ncbi:MAG: type II toxin-antitoxin system HipA family toxin [Synergistaceae bacterium]|jgi:serine/threonine-protein kinase HipA|nr:type II toxin-antitoxin system HipA family toxin [Synergistaceae bacterium]
MNRAELAVFMDLSGKATRIGTLDIFTSRGSEYYRFQYSAAWVESDEGFAIDPALELVSGVPYQSSNLWGAFCDVSPDRWGRLVQSRIKNRGLSDGDFMLGVSDHMRIGALRVSAASDENIFLARHEDVPKLVHLAELERASYNIEKNKETSADLALLLQPGTSIGGARPKAVVENEGSLWIAKFQSSFDTERTALKEAIMLDLAKIARIECPIHRVIGETGRNPILLVKRFDREGSVRVPFMSAMTMLERGETTRGNASYMELADAITRCSSRPEHDRAELWRRMTFGAMTGNTDDHLRNHAFLRDERGWRLSPAYDLNPSDQPYKTRRHELSFDGGSYRPSLELCVKLASYFGVTDETSSQILEGIAIALKSWKTVARKNGMSAAEINRMSVSFEHEDASSLINGK